MRESEIANPQGASVVTDEAAAATSATATAAAAFETMTKTDGNFREQENSIRILQIAYELHTNARTHEQTQTAVHVYVVTLYI